MRNKIQLIITGFLQVFFVSVNTYFLAKENYAGVIIASFMISFIWTLNVKKVAFGNWNDRIIYSLSAMGGSLFGLWFSISIDKIL